MQAEPFAEYPFVPGRLSGDDRDFMVRGHGCMREGCGRVMRPNLQSRFKDLLLADSDLTEHWLAVRLAQADERCWAACNLSMW